MKSIYIKLFSALAVACLCLPALAADNESIAKCVDQELDKLRVVREEIIPAYQRAPRGSLLACETQKRRVTASGVGLRQNERVSNTPVCTLNDARIRDRTSIEYCGMNNNQPVITAAVWGKGCTDENSASWTMRVQYVYEPSTADFKAAMNTCLSRD